MAYAKVLAVIAVFAAISGHSEAGFTDVLNGFGSDVQSILNKFLQQIQNDPSFSINNATVQNEIQQAIKAARNTFNMATNSITNLFNGAGSQIQNAVSAIENGQNPLNALQQGFQEQESEAQTAATNFQQSVKNIASTTGSPN